MKDDKKLYGLKLRLRKWTTPFHIMFGLLCAALIPYYPVASGFLLVTFGFDEWWQYKTIDPKSEKDFWEGGVCAFAIGMGIVLILTLVGVYPI